MNYFQTISSIVMVLGNVTKKLPHWVCRNASSDITSRDVAREWLTKPPGRVQFILSFGFPSSPSHCALRCVFLFASSIRGGGTSQCYALSPRRSGIACSSLAAETCPALDVLVTFSSFLPRGGNVDQARRGPRMGLALVSGFALRPSSPIRPCKLTVT